MIAPSQIKDHMEVRASDGRLIGKVDHIAEDNRIKLTKADAFDHRHHLIPLDWVDHVDRQVHLNVTGSEALNNWEDDEEEMSGAESGGRSH
jgi:hypothetical protein